MMHRRHAVAVLAGSALLLAGCTASASSGTPATVSRPAGFSAVLPPDPPAGEVYGQGTIVDDGAGATLCLGGFDAIAPPRCSGIPVAGLSWDRVADATSAEGTTWAASAVWGTYDGHVFTLTRTPLPLAILEAMPVPDPTNGRPGRASRSDMTVVRATAPEAIGDDYLDAYEQDGWVFVDVAWDDGTWQAAADASFGVGKIVVRSALMPVG